MPDKYTMLRRRRTAFAALLLPAALAMAAPGDDEDLALAFGDRDMVSIATGGALPLRRAPAVASVITARDIAAMGATDLDQVLESVAGVHVSRWNAPLLPIYTFRGIVSQYNPQVLMLVNGIAITSAFTGNRGQAWGGLPLENIARIEVIRGPGSALYGADALAGVINIITKTADEIKGTETGLRVGSFGERDAYLQHGGHHGGWQVAAYLRVGQTDGTDRTVEKDVQTTLDGLFHTHASLAPGPVNAYRGALDARVDVAYESWRLRAAYQERKVGIGVGLADAVDPYGRLPEQREYVDLSYNQVNWALDWDIQAIAGFNRHRQMVADPGFLLFPPGAFGNAFPQGVYGAPGNIIRNDHASMSGLYHAYASHRLRLGAGFRSEDLYAATERKNFNFTVVPGVGPALLPLGADISVDNNPALLYQPLSKRTVRYVFIQDEWQFAKDWMLTAGLRHDNYTDFGGTTNPRLAVVWDASYDLTVKLMHGRAFRAPSFTEQHSLNNPVNIGNPDLAPERMRTTEMSFGWQPTLDLKLNATLFELELQDMIVATANADPSTGKTFRNVGHHRGKGMELEAGWEPSRQLHLSGNLSLQKLTDQDTGMDAGRAPQQRWYWRVDWQPLAGWQFGSAINRVSKRMREAGDPRPSVPDYTTVDASLRYNAGPWSIRATVLNLFDRDVREPTPSPGNVPLDIPMPGRSFQLTLTRSL